MLPGILNQLGAENLANLKKIATSVSSGGRCNQGLSVGTGRVSGKPAHCHSVSSLVRSFCMGYGLMTCVFNEDSCVSVAVLLIGICNSVLYIRSHTS